MGRTTKGFHRNHVGALPAGYVMHAVWSYILPPFWNSCCLGHEFCTVHSSKFSVRTTTFSEWRSIVQERLSNNSQKQFSLVHHACSDSSIRTVGSLGSLQQTAYWPSKREVDIPLMGIFLSDLLSQLCYPAKSIQSVLCSAKHKQSAIKILHPF
jgi:hypothetical protein